MRRDDLAGHALVEPRGDGPVSEHFDQEALSFSDPLDLDYGFPLSGDS